MALAGIKERISVPRLYTQPITRRFGTEQYPQFIEFLESPQHNCIVRAIGTPEDLLLNADGYTKDGFRYGWTGFKGVTKMLCDGLQTTLLDMTGIRQTKQQHGLCDFPAAVSLFNTLVRLRFERFQSSQMVCSLGDKTIDGIVGQTYQFLTNRRYVELMDGQELPAKFLAAQLVGRRLLIWYREQEPAFVLANRGVLFPQWRGFFGSNSEGANTSVRLTSAVYSQHGTALADYEGNGRRQVHLGSDFDKRVAEMFRHVVKHAPSVEDYTKLTAECGTKLEIPTNQKQQQRRIDQLAARVRRNGIPRAVAHEIVMLGLTQGADANADVLVSPDSNYRFPVRTRYDLACGAMRCGIRIGPARREPVEQIAYAILTGAINLQE